MRGLPPIVFPIALSSMCPCVLAAEAETTPETPPAMTMTSTMDEPTPPAMNEPPQPTAPPGHTATQMQHDEIAVLLEHLQSQHVYLKHLENVRRALEKELAIVRLMGECDRSGGACTGHGFTADTAFEESQRGVHEPIPAALPPQSSPALSPALGPPSPLGLSSAPALEWPVVIGVYRETATLNYLGREFEVRAGNRVGPFTVTAVTLDRIELDGPTGATALAARWYPPVAKDEPDGFLRTN